MVSVRELERFRVFSRRIQRHIFAAFATFCSNSVGILLEQKVAKAAKKME